MENEGLQLPGFAVTVSDNSYSHLGIFKGDRILCDYLLSPARFVVAIWDGLAHVCTDVGGHLFDESTRTDAPADAVPWGRVVEIVRRLTPVDAVEVSS